MSRLLLRAALFALTVVCVARTVDAAHPQMYSDDLFYNYYVGPSSCGQSAQMYVSPVPTPPRVGHTYITYQPFYPHEYMWRHSRTYHSRNTFAGSRTTTTVRYW